MTMTNEVREEVENVQILVPSLKIGLYICKIKMESYSYLG